MSGPSGSGPAGQPEIAAVEELERATDRVREEARAELGITGHGDVPPLRRVMREEGVSLYPIIALSVLALVNVFQGYAFTVLTPDISRSLGISIGTIAAVDALTTLAIALAPLPMARLSQGKPRRALLSVATGLVWSVLTLFTGFVTSLAGLILVLVFDGLSTGSVAALHVPLLMDSYPPKVRVRALSAYSALGDVGLAFVLSPLLVAGLTEVFSLTWRGVFVVLGVLSLM